MKGFLKAFGAATALLAVAAGASRAAIPEAKPSAAASYERDLAAFFKEVDATYPFFDLKGIRGDWAQTKARLAERVKLCASDREFLGLVTEAIRCLRDAHMGVSQAKVSPPAGPKRYYPGVSFMPAAQGRLVVMAAEAHADALKPGTVVTRIDGRDARTVLEEKAKEAYLAQVPSAEGRAQR